MSEKASGQLKKSLSTSVGQTKIVVTPLDISQTCDKLGWKFNVFVSSTGSTALQKTIDEQDVVVIQQFKARVRYLANTPRIDWKTPHALKLQGVKDIYEIRFSANGVQFRPFGFFGPGSNEFTILVWATHKQKIYDPNDAIKTAERRRKAVETGSAFCVPLKIDGEKFPCA
jgi:hypothetical protein